MQRFQSILQFKKVSCKNCYKCVRNCPVKAIRVHDHQARIIESQCIYCEKCILVCPQDAKEEQNMIPAICNAMENKTQVIASLHPAYLARFGVTGINGIREAMKKLGFADAADAAEGASLMISQYRALFAEQKEPGIMISSACNRTACQETLSASSGKSGTVCLYDAVSCQLSEKKISEGRDCLCKSLYFSYVRVERLRK
jgi:iron only hydrogenase large subunit-like protein